MLALLAKYKAIAIAAALLGALGIGGAGVVAANGGLPVALGAITGQQATTTASHTQTSATMTKHNPANGLAHGTIITSVNGAWVTYTVDVGVVASATSDSMTLNRLDGQQVTLTITPTTVWGKGHTAPKHLTKLTGKRIVVFSQNGVALQIGGGAALRKQAIHLDGLFVTNGKTREVVIDLGAVQSVSTTEISVKRADGVIVTEAVAAKARWVQAPNHTAIQPSQVATGATVAIVTVKGKVIAVRLSASSAS